MNSMPDVPTTEPWMGTLLGIMTAVFLACFVGWTVWAWLPRNRKNMEEASRLPLDDDFNAPGEVPHV